MDSTEISTIPDPTTYSTIADFGWGTGGAYESDFREGPVPKNAMHFDVLTPGVNWLTPEPPKPDPSKKGVVGELEL